MLGLMLGLVAQAAVAASAPVERSINANAHDLFDRDAALKAWALREYDTNRDGWLTSYEAQPALAAFKNLADGDRDGRVTRYEYDRAKEFIAARK